MGTVQNSIQVQVQPIWVQPETVQLQATPVLAQLDIRMFGLGMMVHIG